MKEKLPRDTQWFVCAAGVILLVVAAQWIAESLRQGQVVAWFKTANHTGPIAWAALAFAVLGGLLLVASSLRNLRSGRGEA